MKTAAVARSACWLCAVLDLLSTALTLSPSAPTPSPHLGQLWTRLMARGPPEGGGRKEPGGEFRTRFVRDAPQAPSFLPYIALDHGISPLSQDARDTEVLRFINNSLNARPSNCSPKNRNIMLDYDFRPSHFQQPFQEQVKKAVQIANVLNSLFLYNRQPQDLYNNVTYFALTHSLVQGDPKVKGCGIAFQLGQYRPVPPNVRAYFFPYSYRAANGATVVSDLTSYYEPFNTSWFFNQSNRDPARLAKAGETMFTNASDVGAYFRKYEARWTKTVRVSETDGFWADPYYDCLLEAWILQFSVPFFEMVNGTAVFKGVVLLDLDFSAMEINQCDDEDNKGALFANTHRCRGESTQCVHIPGNGLRWGTYMCECKPEFYFPNRNSTTANRSGFPGRDVELTYLDMIHNKSLNYTQDFMCLPCRKGCERCEGDEPCVVEFNVFLRGIPLGIQSYCMTIAVVVAFVIARLRKTKVMRSSVWLLLEMIVLGALLLYATVVIQYFEPTAINCLLLPWFREVGFAIMYGTLVLKIYRILAEFQSRKAHRVHVREKDLFKSLAVILVVVFGYMGAWTAVNMDHLSSSSPSPLLLNATTPGDGLSYVLCTSLWWDYAIEIAEVVFLAVGVYLCYCVRSAPSDYSEGRFISIALLYELIISTTFYVLKHVWWLELHPDHLFLMYFFRCQITVSVNLMILLAPVLWYAYRPPDDDRMRTRAYSQSDVGDSVAPETMKLNVGISSNGDVDVGEISLTEMDPEDIRAELKRLYTQLQIYKTKTMRKDNPHISKRRGGRKQTHRRFSLQAFHHKHRHHHEHETEHEMSKTPEESTNSAEAMTFPMEPSVKEEPNEGGSSSGSRNPPSVSFKPGHL